MVPTNNSQLINLNLPSPPHQHPPTEPLTHSFTQSIPESHSLTFIICSDRLTAMHECNNELLDNVHRSKTPS